MTPSGDPSVWADFPVDRSPRPLVLLADRLRLPGFTTGEAKEAWGDGLITVAADVPPEVLAELPRRRAGATGPEIVLDRVCRVDAPFRTDRGPVPLPAWRLDGPDLLDAGCVVLDPAVTPWWSLGDHPQAQGWWLDGTVDATGLTVGFPASGGWFTEFLHAEFEEHETYVVGRGVTREVVPPGVDAVPLVLRTANVTGRLRRPLGNRVLVDEAGGPVAVVVAD